jgi:hypothetical protein
VHDTGVSSPRRALNHSHPASPRSVLLLTVPFWYLHPGLNYGASGRRLYIYAASVMTISPYVSNRKAIQLLLGTVIKAQITLRTSPRCTSYYKKSCRRIYLMLMKDISRGPQVSSSHGCIWCLSAVSCSAMSFGWDSLSVRKQSITIRKIASILTFPGGTYT